MFRMFRLFKGPLEQKKNLLKIILGEVNWILIHFAMTISLDFFQKYSDG